MTLELRLVVGDVLDADAELVAPHLDDLVDEQERIAVRQRFMIAMMSTVPSEVGASGVVVSAASVIQFGPWALRAGLEAGSTASTEKSLTVAPAGTRTSAKIAQPRPIEASGPRQARSPIRLFSPMTVS
ncbi:hypothetical protein [Chenggangzhangella methanolivorans]|uniref:hypothetical protein n=1 Tax=Chenggangzhangella methanolivorans TaxID=1437009 RepID=UPI0028F40037|nr:hypothetical protein [Chenggangzhangella methanolivorans]